MSKIKINPAILKAALYCASTDEARSHLTTLCLSRLGASVYVTATNGVVMFAHTLPDIDVTAVPEGLNNLLCADHVRTVLSLVPKTRGKQEPIAIELELGQTGWTAIVSGRIMTFEYSGGRYPNWARVVRGANTSDVSFTYSHTIDFATKERTKLDKAFLALTRGVGHIRPNGKDPAFYVNDAYPDALGVIMPLVQRDSHEADMLISDFVRALDVTEETKS